MNDFYNTYGSYFGTPNSGSQFAPQQGSAAAQGSSGPSAGAAFGAAAGGALAVAGSVLDIFNQNDFQKQITDQLDLAGKQYSQQLAQINLNQNIADLGAAKRANNAFANQLARIGANGVAASSSSQMAAFNATSASEYMSEFSNLMTATSQRLNTYYSQAAFAKQAANRIEASGNQIVGDVFSGASDIGTLIAMAF